jgi:hypothetical protein
MRAIIESFLPLRRVAGGDASPNTVLRSALYIPQVDLYTKQLIALTLTVLPLLKDAEERLPDETATARREVQEEIRGKSTTEELIQSLRELRQAGTYESHMGCIRGDRSGH